MVTASEVSLCPGHCQPLNPLPRGTLQEMQLRASQRWGRECPEIQPGVSLSTARRGEQTGDDDLHFRPGFRPDVPSNGKSKCSQCAARAGRARPACRVLDVHRLESGVRVESILPSSLRGQLMRRVFQGVAREKVHSVPLRETVRLGARGSLVEGLLCSGERTFSVIGMYRHFDGRVARRLRQIEVDAVYAYEGGALRPFARQEGEASPLFMICPAAIGAGNAISCAKRRRAVRNWQPSFPSCLT